MAGCYFSRRKAISRGRSHLCSKRNSLMSRLSRPAFGLVVCIAFATEVQGQDSQSLEGYIRLHYTKQEHLIPMRDGVKLFTSIYIPQDTSRKYPLLMKRTP